MDEYARAEQSAYFHADISSPVSFHYIGKQASMRWAGGVDLSMMSEAEVLDPAEGTFREYQRVVDPKYLDQIRTEAKQFSYGVVQYPMMHSLPAIARSHGREFADGLASAPIPTRAAP